MNYINKLKSNINKEYYPLMDDLTRMISILIITNILMFLNNPSKNKILSEYYVNIIVFVSLGIITYWLVLKKIIVFN
jgi:hypothetical protein